jgi:SAM-dependent methyltransferase
MADEAGRLAALARAWDEAAAEYERYFVPRFAPWVTTAVDAMPNELPPGPILVPCCGTFPELPALASIHPDREIVGVDLSAGMISLARDRAAPWPSASARVGDATRLSDDWPGTSAGVVSVFGLQQLPDPPGAIADWVDTLRPGGVLSVVYWPAEVEADGPFALLDRVLAPDRKPGDGGRGIRLEAAVVASGATLVRHTDLSHPMSHPDATTFWEAMTTGGPLRALANAKGDDFVRTAGAEFIRLAPPGPWRHRPRARWIVARRH